MEQQSNYPVLKIPADERELYQYLDQLYAKTQKAKEDKKVVKHNGLLEIIISPITIQTAIHNIKGNRGAETPGTDGETMRQIIELPYELVIGTIQEQCKQYQPRMIRRVNIPKPGKQEKRPLGIPAVIDRIIQECVRIVIEPILEAQFYSHSYGFRPYRDTHMALERVTDIVHKTGYHWIIEGDIKSYFDTINHTRLIKQLWHLGIRDKRVLMMIKQMLKAGIMGEIERNPIGTQQGGILSPLLANVYLNTFDWSVAKAWGEKVTRYAYATTDGKLKSLRKRSKLKPAYIIRYADDWVLVTNTKINAEKWKKRLQTDFETKYKLALSEEKTKITNVRKRPIIFLGFTFKVIPYAKARKGYKTKTRPHPTRLKSKIDDLREQIRQIGKQGTLKQAIGYIHILNSQIRGIIQYYEKATHITVDINKHSWNLMYLAYREMKKLGGHLVPANQTDNLSSVHSLYTTKIPAIEVNGQKIGLTSLTFCKWRKTSLKNQEETPYTQEGRERYQRRTGKARRLFRQDKLFDVLKTVEQTNGWGYNFEYHLNCAYAFNRDKGTCRVCKVKLGSENVEFHRIRPTLSLEALNRVPNLASVCKTCHARIHGTVVHPKLPAKSEKRLNRMREKLLLTNHEVLMERAVKRKFHAVCESGEKGFRTAQNACEDIPYLLTLGA